MATDLDVSESCQLDRQAITLDIDNCGSSVVTVRIFDAYANETAVQKIRTHAS